MPVFNNEEWKQATVPDEFTRVNPTEEELAKQQAEKGITPPTLMDTVKAAFKTENTIGSYLEYGFNDSNAKGSYDSFSKLTALGRTDLIPQSVYVDNDDELYDMIDKQDRIAKQQQILADSGWLGMGAAMAAGTIDPTILIPGAGTVRAATKLASITKTAIFGAVTAGSLTAAQEGFLTTTTNKDLTDVAYAGVAGAFLGGVLGGGYAAWTKSPMGVDVSKEIAKTLKTGEGSKIDLRVDVAEGKSVGAAGLSIEDQIKSLNFGKKEEGFRSDFYEGFAKKMSSPIEVFRSPKIQGLTSPYLATRNYTNHLFDTSEFTLGKDIAGVARETDVESLLKVDLGNLELKSQEVLGMYHDYLGIKPDSVGVNVKAAIKGRRKDSMSFEDFSTQLDTALRSGDVHKVPQIEKAAKLIRKDMNKTLKEMQELKLLPEDLSVKGADSYFRRSYNVSKIQNNRRTFEDVLENHFIRNGMDDADAQMQATKTTDNILGRGDKQIELSFASDGGGKLLKERTLDIPDEDIDAFLDKDAIANWQSYMAQSSGIIQLNRKLQSMGYENLAQIKKEIKAESDLLLQHIDKQMVKGTIDQKKGESLIKKEGSNYNKALKQIDDWANLVTGRVGHPKDKIDKFLKNLRKYQTMRLLGGMAISALPDMGAHIFQHGLRGVVKHGIMPMVRSIKTSKAAKDELKHFNVGLELSNNETLRIMSDGDFNLMGGKSKLDHIMDSTTDFFGKLTLNTHWTYMGKRLAAQETTGNIMETIETYLTKGKIPEHKRIRLNRLGIHTDDFAPIMEQFNRFGKKYKGSYVNDFRSWSDTALRDKLGTAIMKEVDATILTPGRGDVPYIFQSNQVMKTIFQFKSFTSTATNKILLAGLQRRNSNAVMGATAMVALGAASWAVKEAIAGREIKDPSVHQVLREGVSRSGVTSLMMDAGFALNPYSQSSRYAGSNANSYVLGVSANFVADMANVANIAAKPLKGEEVDKTDISKLTRMLPFQNLFWLRMAIEQTKK